MPTLLILILSSATPLTDARARLETALQPEHSAGLVELAEEGSTLVVRLNEGVFKKIDPLWKVLGSVAKESLLPEIVPIRVEFLCVSPPDPKTVGKACSARLQTVSGYLYELQRVDPQRVSILLQCRVGG